MKYLRMPMFLLCGLGLWACNAVLGTSDFKPSTCKEGGVQCAGNTVEHCVGGVWSAGENCGDKSCRDSACVGSCANVDKLDLLFAIDNSRSMADKQQILSLTIPDLVKRLINPRCTYRNGEVSSVQPSSPADRCPADTFREFEPIFDIHIGIVSSSIGGHGADSCPDTDTASKECAPVVNTTNNDKGHLLARVNPCDTQEAPTFMNKKFLAWDPSNKYGGETVVDDGNGHGIVPTLRDMVTGLGEIGCGYESQLESIYRFLADPSPYETIAVVGGSAMPMGEDTLLLEQRRDFLRPDSSLAVVMLSDENDCSIKEYGSFYYVGQLHSGATPVRMPRARQECATDPADPCCKSCGQAPGAGCPDDPNCKDPNGGPGPALLTDAEDHTNLRCWDQKRRFGIDFLYPTSRYVQAFSNVNVADHDGNIVPNPIFSDLDPNDGNANIRDPSLVFVMGIVGVPWQDIARNKSDLKQGFKTAVELETPVDNEEHTTWDRIVGDPDKYVKPLDPLMRESMDKREGANPVTGDILVDSSAPNSNPINGHEWTIFGNGDLQYACIFPLLPGNERDCTDVSLAGCDCTLKTNDNPLCASNPKDMNLPTRQIRAKAYPSLRQLAVLRGLGSQGIVASICPAQVDDETAADFGYRPAVDALVGRMQSCLAERRPPAP